MSCLIIQATTTTTTKINISLLVRGGSVAAGCLQLFGRATRPVSRPVAVIMPMPTTIEAMNNGIESSKACDISLLLTWIIFIYIYFIKASKQHKKLLIFFEFNFFFVFFSFTLKTY
jgi:hypothetical protein